MAKKKEVIVSEEKSFEGFSIITFIKRNPLKLLALVIGLLTLVIQQFPETATALAGILAIAEEAYKYFSKKKTA